MINYIIKLYGESTTIILENFNYEEDHKCLKVSDISHMQQRIHKENIPYKEQGFIILIDYLKFLSLQGLFTIEKDIYKEHSSPIKRQKQITWYLVTKNNDDTSSSSSTISETNESKQPQNKNNDKQNYHQNKIEHKYKLLNFKIKLGNILLKRNNNNIPLSKIKHKIQNKQEHDFDEKNQGFKKLITLIKACSDIFDILSLENNNVIISLKNVEILNKLTNKYKNQQELNKKLETNMHKTQIEDIEKLIDTKKELLLKSNNEIKALKTKLNQMYKEQDEMANYMQDLSISLEKTDKKIHDKLHK